MSLASLMEITGILQVIGLGHIFILSNMKKHSLLLMNFIKMQFIFMRTSKTWIIQENAFGRCNSSQNLMLKVH